MSALYSTGTLYPGSASDNNSFGQIAWNNPGNIKAIDQQYATAIWLGSAGTTNYLQGNNFNFKIPPQASIQGIEVIKTGNFNGAGGGSSVAQLTLNGSPVGNIKQDNFGGTDTTIVVGGINDVWGTSFSASDISGTGFGCVLWSGLGSATATVSLDAVSMAVFYTTPGETFRVSLPGNDAGTGTATNSFTAIADDSTVLIKEKTRGSVTLAYGSTQSILHLLSYAPLCLFWGYEGTNAGTLDYIGGNQNPFQLANWNINVDTTSLNIIQGANPSGSAIGFYYIFYDKIQ